MTKPNLPPIGNNPSPNAITDSDPSNEVAVIYRGGRYKGWYSHKYGAWQIPEFNLMGVPIPISEVDSWEFI